MLFVNTLSILATVDVGTFLAACKFTTFSEHSKCIAISFEALINYLNFEVWI